MFLIRILFVILLFTTMPIGMIAHTTLMVPIPAALRADFLALHTAQYDQKPPLCINTDLLYEASFRPRAIAHTLFSPDLVRLHNRDIVRISGSDAPRRCPHDWFGDYFGLKRPTITNFSFDPWVNNYLLTTDVEYQFSCAAQWSVRIFAPLIYTRWNLGVIEHNIQAAQCNSSYPAGYFADLFTPVTQVPNAASVIGVPCVSLLCTARQFFSDMLTPNLTTPNNSSFFVPLKVSRFSRGPQSKFVLADIYATIGRTIMQGNRGHAKLLVATIIPTSSYSDTSFLFSPMAGNGGHWGLGGALDAHAYVWQSPYNNSWWAADAYLSVTHLFSKESCRTLDLRGKPHSRYMTTIQLQQNGADLSQNRVFAHLFNPLANLSTVAVKTNINIQANGALIATFAYHKQRYSFGYDFYARTCENIALSASCKQLDNGQWALKGDAFVYGFVPTDIIPTQGQANLPLALAVSQSEATIHAGTNNTGAQSNLTLFAENRGIDNAEPVFYDELIVLTRQPAQTNDPINQQLQSVPPITLQLQDLDLDSARTTAHQQAVVAQWAYLFQQPEKTGSIRIGFKIAWANNVQERLDIFTKCPNTAFNIWSIWLGGGLAF